MGNINTLNRDGAGSKQYNYDGNKLTSVTGLSGAYGYDLNGNATTDGRNGMGLTYNYLNLPVIANKPGTALSYTYTAAGQKLAKTATVNGITTNRKYINGIEYNGNTIDLIHTDEGVTQNIGGTYTYHYNLSDHLGNVRYTFDVYNGAVRKLQSDDYYAFGKRRSVAPVSLDNKYLYNGKELQDELACAGEDGQFDYGARFYDPVVGRWNVVDPLAEKFNSVNPYNYVDNNPVLRIDPNGMEGTSTHTDRLGNVLAVYDDGDLGVYKHENAKTKEDIDKTYSDKNTSAGGEKMGKSLQIFSFVDGKDLESGKITPIGKIDFESQWAKNKVNYILSDMKGRTLNYYAANARSSNSTKEYKFDIKYRALKEFGSIYYGSLLYDNVYTSARDAGNFAAGLVQDRSPVPNIITSMGFGIYQQKGINSNVLKSLFFGEEKQSGMAQKLGREYDRSGYLQTFKGQE